MKDCWTGVCASLYLEWIAYLKDQQLACDPAGAEP